MKENNLAIGFTKAGDLADRKIFHEFIYEPPQLSEHDLLIRVQASGLNPIDLWELQRLDKPLSTPRILGFDGMGTVEKVGTEVKLFKVGDQVFYAGTPRRNGSYATQQVVDERLVGHAPTNLKPAQSATIPLAFLTVWECLVEKLGLSWAAKETHKGQTILIVNAGGGVGSYAVQLAKLLNLTVIATASRKESQDWVYQNGADIVIDHRQAFKPQLIKKGHDQVAMILDLYGLDERFKEFCDLIAPNGQIVTIGQSKKDLPFYLLKRKAATLSWEMVFTKDYYQLATLNSQHEILEQAKILCEQGLLKPALTTTIEGLTINNLQQGLTQLATHQTIGKIALLH